MPNDLTLYTNPMSRGRLARGSYTRAIEKLGTEERKEMRARQTRARE